MMQKTITGLLDANYVHRLCGAGWVVNGGMLGLQGTSV